MGNPFNNLSKEAVSVQKGSIIMREGEIGQCAYFVVQGRLLVEKNINGENVPIAEIGPRDMVGEFAILDDAPRSATVTALENSVLIVLNKTRIRSLIRRSPAVAEVIMKLLCHKLRNRYQASKNSNELDNPDVWRRICMILLLCAKSEENPAVLYQTFSSQVEAILELPSKTVSELIERLEKAAAIETQGKKTLCVNEDKLQIFVEQNTEEYANIPIETFSEAKEYQAAQVILEAFPEDMRTQEFIEVPKAQVTQVLVASSLWKDLRPQFQYQRSEAMLQYLLAREQVKPSASVSGDVLIYPAILEEIPIPQNSLIAYESMKTALLTPAS